MKPRCLSIIACFVSSSEASGGAALDAWMSEHRTIRDIDLLAAYGLAAYSGDMGYCNPPGSVPGEQIGRSARHLLVDDLVLWPLCKSGGGLYLNCLDSLSRIQGVLKHPDSGFAPF